MNTMFPFLSILIDLISLVIDGISLVIKETERALADTTPQGGEKSRKSHSFKGVC